MKSLLDIAASTSTPPPASLDSLFARAAIMVRYNPGSGALTAAISSGRISLIHNTDLRDRIAGWEAVTSDLVVDEQTELGQARRGYLTNKPRTGRGPETRRYQIVSLAEPARARSAGAGSEIIWGAVNE